MLQVDSGDETVQLLRLIAQQQVGNLTLTVTSALPPTTPDTRYIIINILWFASLVCNLVTASLGMLLKQWFSEYLSNSTLAPQERMRIRYFRYQGLLAWRVFEIAAFLPLLLQTAIILFLTGLAIWTSTLNYVLGKVVLILIVTWGAFLFGTTAAPLLWSKCPYKSPFLKPTLQEFRASIHRGSRNLFTAIHKSLHLSGPPLAQWTDVTEDQVRTNTKLDLDILADAHKLFMDEDILKSIQLCFEDGKISYSFADVTKCFDTIATQSGRGSYRDLTGVDPSSLALRAALRRVMLRSLDADLTWEPWMEETFVFQMDQRYANEEPQMDKLLTLVRRINGCADLSTLGDNSEIMESIMPYPYTRKHSCKSPAGPRRSTTD